MLIITTIIDHFTYFLISLVDGRQYTFRGKRTIPELEEFIEGGYVSVDSTAIPTRLPPDSDLEEAIHIISV